MVTWDDTWKVFQPILPSIAEITSDEGGVLVGGTALAIQLQHRASFDIDVQTQADFDSHEMGDRLRGLHGRVITTSTNYVEAVLDDVRVEVWKSRYRETPIEDGPIVVGMPIASLSDLFALKLKAVVDRKQFRDFFDISALLTEVMSLVDGLRCYAYRFQRFLTTEEVGDVLQALQCPSDYIPADPNLDSQRPQVLPALSSAAEKALDWLSHRERLDNSAGSHPDKPRMDS